MNQTTTRPRADGAPRVCACILMNHPFPANLPLLREIYRARFSEVRFLIPFERLPDEDVITVYRGSYNHATYLTDAQHILSQIDCDYYMIIQDDVLLNPGIAEETFAETFRLGTNDGFIAWADSTQPQIGRCAWHFGFVARFLHPKSMLFGSGIEADTLARYLPEPAKLGAAIAASGIPSTSATRFVPGEISREAFGHAASRILMHGLSAEVDEEDGDQRVIEWQSVEAERMLIHAMLGAQRKGALAPGEDLVPLPIPTVTGNYYTDFYILPKSGFDEFCHLIGVAGAANLFVEIMAPTMLFACCDRVRTADEVGLDFSGFAHGRNLRWFEDPRHAAIHPFKLSQFRHPKNAEALTAALAGLGRGEPMAQDLGVSFASFGRWPAGFVGAGEGWHLGEDWGVWAARPEATMRIVVPTGATVRVTVRTPLFPTSEVVSGRFTYNQGRASVPFAIPRGQSDLVVSLDGVEAGPDGLAELVLTSDAVVRPRHLDPNADDDRTLGIGIVNLASGK